MKLIKSIQLFSSKLLMQMQCSNNCSQFYHKSCITMEELFFYFTILFRLSKAIWKQATHNFQCQCQVKIHFNSGNTMMHHISLKKQKKKRLCIILIVLNFSDALCAMYSSATCSPISPHTYSLRCQHFYIIIVFIFIGVTYDP